MISRNNAEDYVRFRSSPANDGETDSQWCTRVGETYNALVVWKSANSKSLERILATRRAQYADEMIKIDGALLARAKAGDPKSIQLAWARFENWSPRIEEKAQERNPTNKTLAELIAEEG